MPDAGQQRGRILCVTSNFPRWAGDSTTPFVLHLAQDLQALGWQVDVLAPHADHGTASQEEIAGVHVERFSYLWPQRAQTVCYKGGALVNLRRAPSNLLKLPAFVLAELAAVNKRLASGRYDLLHSHWILPQGFVGALAASWANIPHVLTVHGGDVFALKGSVLRKFKEYALHNASVVTVNSSATEAAVRDIAPDVQRLQRIPMGVEVRDVEKTSPEVLELRTRYRRGKGPLLVFVGRLVEEKGVGDLLHAIALLKSQLTDVTAVIAGEGQERERFEAASRELGIADRIAFTGWVQPADVPIYLAAGDVFVGPSRWFEAQGLTFLEAMIAKTPVVATKVGGIVDSVKHEETGLLVDQCAPEQIAAAIIRVSNDEGLATSLTASAYEKAIADFSRTASAERFSTLFSTSLNMRQ